MGRYSQRVLGLSVFSRNDIRPRLSGVVYVQTNTLHRIRTFDGFSAISRRIVHLLLRWDRMGCGLLSRWETVARGDLLTSKIPFRLHWIR